MMRSRSRSRDRYSDYDTLAIAMEGFSLPEKVRVYGQWDDPRRSRDAFVSFPSRESCEAFIKFSNGILSLMGTECGIRTIDSRLPRGLSEPSRNHQEKEADWECSKCRFVNFSRRKTCKECRGDRREVEVHERSLVSRKLVLKRLPHDSSEITIAATFQRYAEVREVRYIQSKRIAFVDFNSPAECLMALDCFKKYDGCLIHGCCSKTPVSVSIADDSRQSTATASSDATDWSTQVSAREQAELILASCPALEPYNEYFTDQRREWLFDPESLYWYNYRTKSHYLLQMESKQLMRVDKSSGQLCLYETLPLPEVARRESVAGSSAQVEYSKDRKTMVSHKEEIISENPSSSSLPGPVLVSAVCLICQRKFQSVEALRKHEMFSELHKSNLLSASIPS